ncbi:MAG TPA: hypothetical protein VHX62_03040 [Solirubrobacteraceae bacterium]|nr:hypothetical protein [Solirubrobacteraceae bacterium]
MHVQLQPAAVRRRRHGRRSPPRSGYGRPPRRPVARHRLSDIGAAGALLALPLLLLAAAAYLALALVHAPPAITVAPVARAPGFRGPRPSLAWPAHGEAAVGVQGVGLIGAHGSSRPVPIASLAKVMTAYVVLHDHPLGGRSGGPPIVVGGDDAAAFRADLAAGQSVVPVRAGERLTERQALEGLLLPSGNNLATLLARWDAGSQRAFVGRMNAQARALGLTKTHYADPSGVAASTRSDAADLVRLGMRAMAVPAFARIVGLTRVNLPVAGSQFNLDGLLGTDGIIGIKTGTTASAGGCFLFAAATRAGGRRATVIGVVLDQRGAGGRQDLLPAAFHATTALLAGARGVPARHRLIRAGETLARLRTAWGAAVALRATRAVSVVGWAGLRVRFAVVARRSLSPPLAAGQTAADASARVGGERVTVPLAGAAAVGGPSLGWRLAHP